MEEKQILLVDCCTNGNLALDLNESANIGLTKFKGIFQRADEVNKNRRVYSFSILDENVKKLNEVIQSGSLIGELDHPCLTTDDFRVLTANGWKSFNQIRTGDSVWSRVEGRMVASKVNAIIDEPYDGYAYDVKGRSINCKFTPNHKFLLAKRYEEANGQLYATIEDIHNNREKFGHSPIPKTAKWQGNETNKFTINGCNRKLKGYKQRLEIDIKKFVAFLGIYLAEGSIKKRSNRIEIYQKNESGRDLIREMLNNFHEEIEWKEIKTGFYAVDARLYDYLVPLGNKYTKYIPQEVKNLATPYLEELLHWFAIGDGTVLAAEDKCIGSASKSSKTEFKDLNIEKYGRLMVYTVSKKLIEDLHECLIKTGRCGSRSVEITKKDYIYADRIIKASNKKPLYKLNISRSKFIHLDPRFLHIAKTHHSGRIYCLSTEHGNFYMECNGKSFWTGNSDSILHFERASHKITKLWWENKELWGQGEILTTPFGRILKSLLNDGVRVGISSRGVGNGKTDESGVLHINNNFKLLTFDCVADPSTTAAFQEKVVGKESTYIPQYPKNENRHINKNILIASLGNVIKEKSKLLKESLES